MEFTLIVLIAGCFTLGLKYCLSKCTETVDLYVEAGITEEIDFSPIIRSVLLLNVEAWALAIMLMMGSEMLLVCAIAFLFLLINAELYLGLYNRMKKFFIPAVAGVLSLPVVVGISSILLGY